MNLRLGTFHYMPLCRGTLGFLLIFTRINSTGAKSHAFVRYAVYCKKAWLGTTEGGLIRLSLITDVGLRLGGACLFSEKARLKTH